MISLIEARKNVPLIVKAIGEIEVEIAGSRGRGERMGRGNWCRRFYKRSTKEGPTIRRKSMHPFFGPVISRGGNREMAVGRRVAGIRGRDERRERHRRNWCRRFSNMGIIEGVIIKKIYVQPFFGPVIVRVGNCEIAVGRNMASAILVDEVNE
jgi:Fe2+ transport system protein FeoA